MNVEPLLNRVAVKRLEEKSNSGIVIAPSGAKSADRAEVVAVGPGMLDRETGEHIAMDLKAGDIVLINPFLGMKTTVEGEELIIQKEEEILCRIRE